MRVLVGTSGYSYKQWKGTFYPAGLKNADMLRHYAAHLSAVEINNTFYRNPKSSVLARWADEASEGFVFVLKASRRITHQACLQDCDEVLGYLWKAARELGPHLGPILFQLPPYLRKGIPRLAAFLESLPDGLRPVIEPGHASWNDDEVHELLRAHGAALCLTDRARKGSKGADDDEEARQPGESLDDLDLLSTADWGYLRLRRGDYDDAELNALARRVRAQPWREAFVFFKHEDDGPALAKRFEAAFETGAASSSEETP